ncbi:putative rhamnosyl transferase [Jannaschia sp. S6380]|uniref:glycosyltransferase n=1 Tax=Jannaschia sp. S6380 TaxID=2926408 RepID=UPI001FF2FAB8|nr:glycosyltransferase [Jannaschia sp. S6380]MCK0169419.1 putative rhamnosyl transferase [Jannaschia sp. S6380]
MSFRNRIVGVLRFSYPATDGFGASTLDEAALTALLYDPDRLARRFAYLETLTLPSLAAQTDGDFTCVILAGTSLPAPAQARLQALVARHSFLRLLFLDRTGALRAAKQAYRYAVEDDATTHVIGFRIDDDDAVARDYVALTRDRAAGLWQAGLLSGPTAIAFSRGIYWDMTAHDQPFHAYRELQPLGLACAMTTTADMPTCIYRYNHRRLACFVPTYMEPGDDAMFLRTLHDHNDSGRAIPPRAEPLPTARMRRVLADRFGIDADAAMALMSPQTAG